MLCTTKGRYETNQLLYVSTFDRDNRSHFKMDTIHTLNKCTLKFCCAK